MSTKVGSKKTGYSENKHSRKDCKKEKVPGKECAGSKKNFGWQEKSGRNRRKNQRRRAQKEETRVKELQGKNVGEKKFWGQRNGSGEADNTVFRGDPTKGDGGESPAGAERSERYSAPIKHGGFGERLGDLGCTPGGGNRQTAGMPRVHHGQCVQRERGQNNSRRVEKRTGGQGTFLGKFDIGGQEAQDGGIKHPKKIWGPKRKKTEGETGETKITPNKNSRAKIKRWSKTPKHQGRTAHNLKKHEQKKMAKTIVSGRANRPRKKPSHRQTISNKTSRPSTLHENFHKSSDFSNHGVQEKIRGKRQDAWFIKTEN